MTTVLHGTAWLFSSSVVNISDLNPCMKFGFTAPSGTYVQIEGGVFQTSTFSIGIAPRGCTVGNAVLNPGSNFMFDTTFGGTAVSINMAIGRDSNGLPTFTAQNSISNLTLGGVTFTQVSLNINLSAASQSVSYTCNFVLPNSGTFNSDFAVTMNSNHAIQLEGDVALADWTVSNTSFDINSLAFHLSMDTSTGYFYANTSGDLKMGSKASLTFSGTIAVTNDVLQVFNISFNYTHGSTTTAIALNYDSSAHTLSGSYEWAYQKATSHRFCSGCYNYQRHADINIDWAFSVNTLDPAQFTLTLGGSMSGSDISGSVAGTISTMPGVDDSASASIHIEIHGMGSWNDSWSWT